MEDGKLVGKGVAFKLFEFLTIKYNFTYEIVKQGRNIIGSEEEFEGSLLESLYKNVRKPNKLAHLQWLIIGFG